MSTVILAQGVSASRTEAEHEITKAGGGGGVRHVQTPSDNMHVVLHYAVRYAMQITATTTENVNVVCTPSESSGVGGKRRAEASVDPPCAYCILRRNEPPAMDPTHQP